MGGEYAFCDCKDNKEKEGKETNLGIIDDINNFICPIKKVPTKKDFTFRSQNQPLSIEDYKKNSAVNKIIRIYRAYKQKQKYNTNTNNNDNELFEIVRNNNSNIKNNFDKHILKNKLKFKNNGGGLDTYKNSENNNNEIKSINSDNLYNNENNYENSSNRGKDSINNNKKDNRENNSINHNSNENNNNIEIYKSNNNLGKIIITIIILNK